jgi:predicted neuraminidase
MHGPASFFIAAIAIGFCSAACAQEVSKPAKHPAILSAEFLYEKAEFPSCHASTIVETPGGLVAAFFGGTDEGNKDVGIWLCRHDGKQWSAPVEVANGKSDDGQQFPSWNPVLFQVPDGPLVLFYKVGPSPSKWWGAHRIEGRRQDVVEARSLGREDAGRR